MASGNKPVAEETLARKFCGSSAFERYRLWLIGYPANNGVDRAVGLYVSEVDGRNFINSKSIDLKMEESATKDSLGHYVILAGIYHAPPGPPSTYNGYIDEISDLKSWKAGDRPKRRSVHRRSDACLEALLSLLARNKTERLSLKGFPLNNYAH